MESDQYSHMNKQRKWLLPLALMFVILLLASCQSEVISENQQTFIVDRTGERWDISQAVSLGFQAKHFEFGLGRNAFTPLDDEKLSDESNQGVRSSSRIIGIGSETGETKAYSVNRLGSHEIANSKIGEQPIAAAY